MLISNCVYYSEYAEAELPGRVNQQRQLHHIYMKKYIDSLNEDLHEKSMLTSKTRDELEKCQERISDLEKERDQLYYMVQEADENEDV